MKVFLTGGTGFVGSEIRQQLLAAGHSVRCLVRHGSEDKVDVARGVEIHHGDATAPESLQGALAGCDAVVHLVGIIREYPARGITFERLHVEATRNMLAAAQAQGIKRYVHMSANGTRDEADSPYHRSKWQAEELVRNSDLEWTIFRPSVIFGKGGEFVEMLAQLIRRLPAVPVIGDGRYRMAPVAVSDVALVFCRALEKDASVGRTFALCGAGAYSYDEILDLIGRALGKKSVTKIHQPACLVKPVIGLLEGFSAFPITRTQLTMLLEGNVCDELTWSEVFDIEPKDFAAEIGRSL